MNQFFRCCFERFHQTALKYQHTVICPKYGDTLPRGRVVRVRKSRGWSLGHRQIFRDYKLERAGEIHRLFPINLAYGRYDVAIRTDRRIRSLRFVRVIADSRPSLSFPASLITVHEPPRSGILTMPR